MDADTYEEHNWSGEQIVQLIKTRSGLENEFNAGTIKKSLLWQEVHKELRKKYDTSFTKDEIMRKFANLMTTYKRIKKRSFSSGKNTSTWEYFELFEHTYGDRYATFKTEVKASNADVNEFDSDTEINLEFYDFNKTHDADFEVNQLENDESKKSNRYHSMVEYLKHESKQDEKYHKDLMEVEREKIKIEKQRLNLLINIKNTFENDRPPCKKSKIHKVTLETEMHDLSNNDNTSDKSEDALIIDDTKFHDTHDFVNGVSLILSQLRPNTRRKAETEILFYLSELYNEEKLTI